VIGNEEEHSVGKDAVLGNHHQKISIEEGFCNNTIERMRPIENLEQNLSTTRTKRKKLRK